MKALMLILCLLLSACAFAAVPPIKPTVLLKYPATLEPASGAVLVSPTEPAEPANVDLRCVMVSVVNVRSGPGLDYPVVSWFLSGREVIVFEIKNYWLRVGQDLWIAEWTVTEC